MNVYCKRIEFKKYLHLQHKGSELGNEVQNGWTVDLRWPTGVIGYIDYGCSFFIAPLSDLAWEKCGPWQALFWSNLKLGYPTLLNILKVLCKMQLEFCFSLLNSQFSIQINQGWPTSWQNCWTTTRCWFRSRLSFSMSKTKAAYLRWKSTFNSWL